MDHNEICGPEYLHNPDGTLANPGYARRLHQIYSHDRIKASKWRLKEWDYYLVNDDECAICFTMSDLGYVGLYSVSLIDFGVSSERILDNPQPHLAAKGVPACSKTTTVLVPFPFGKTGLPHTSAAGVSSFEHKKMRMTFTVENGQRHLCVWVKDFLKGEPLEADIILDDEPQDSMVIATPFAEDPHAYYFNQKIVAMCACGSFAYGGKVHTFDRATALGLLDWGRGVWTRDNTWYWAAAQGYQEGHRLGFNLGYGFGDTSAASENMFFFDGIAHKLDQVDFGIPEDGLGKTPAFLEPWHITSSDDRVDLVFTPIVDRADFINAVLVVSDQHQVMGRCNGTVTLDDGTRFEVRDLMTTAEKVHNKW